MVQESKLEEKTYLISRKVETQNETHIIQKVNGTLKESSVVKGLIAISSIFVGFIFIIILISSSTSSPNRVGYLMGMGQTKILLKIVTHPEPPTSLWGNVQKPYPTGAFWTNLVVRNGDGAVAIHPYGVKCLDNGIQVSYGATRRIVSQLAVSDIFVSDLQISAKESYISRAVESYDNVSVTMTYRTTANGRYRTSLVKGSPFVTVVYEGATPVISANLMQILNVEAKVVKGSIGIQYIVTLGNFQKWLVYCSEPIAFTWKDNALAAPSAIRGMVRVAILPLQNIDTSFNLLLGYVQRYPIGAVVTINYPTGSTMCITYQYLTAGSGPLLMLALTHQTQVMSYPDNDESRTAQTIYTPIYSMKGKLKAIVGDFWKLQYTMTNAGWNYVVADKLSNAQLDIIAFWLQQEVKSVIPSSQDPYGFGKEIGRMARLAVIADNLGIADARQIAIFNLENSLSSWLLGANVDALVYDRTYGGIVTTRGLNDINADYGSGWYADHHFHYGYFVYAFAVLAKLDVPYWDARKTIMELLVRDICTYDPNDSDFPFARHKDMFDGHSWASGLTQQSNGKGQESSSEAINAYYGCYLYGLATANADLSNLAHGLLTTEIQATQIYWHINFNSDIYDAIFASNRMAGNVGAFDVTASTWFGSNLEYVHGINMMPVTPALAAVLDQPYVEQQWPLLATRLPATTAVNKDPTCAANSACAALGLTGNCCPAPDGSYLVCCDTANTPKMMDEWRSLLYIDHAVVDREAAWNQILSLGSVGSGNSKANSLFWTATRPPPRPTYDNSVKPITAQQSIKSACSANSACDAIGMTDDCCPSALGIYLGCCPKIIGGNVLS